MQRIYGKDGQSFDFPDDTPDDEIKGALAKYYGRSEQQPQQQEEETFEDNVGTFSFLADIRDRGKAIDRTIDSFNRLQDLDDTSPEFQKELEEFQKANEEVGFYSHEDNFFLSLTKNLATDVAAVLGSGYAGAQAGALAGSLAGPAGAGAGAFIGGAGAAGGVGFERSRRQMQAFNAYRELQESGDLTNEELREAANTAIIQAGLEGGADAITGGLASKVGKGIVKKVLLDSTMGATTEVGAQALQRAYVSNLDVLGEGAVEEYLQAAMEGAVAQGALSTGLNVLNRGSPDADAPEVDIETEVDAKDVVERYSEATNPDDALEILRQAQDPDFRKEQVLKRKAEKIREGKSIEEQAKDSELAKIEEQLESIKVKQANKDLLTKDLFDNEDVTTEVKRTTKDMPKHTFKDMGALGMKRYTEFKVDKDGSERPKGTVDFQTSKKKGTVTVKNIEAKTLKDKVDLLKNVVVFARDNGFALKSDGLKHADVWKALDKAEENLGVRYNKKNENYRVTSIPKSLEQPTKAVPWKEAIIKEKARDIGKPDKEGQFSLDVEEPQRKSQDAKDVEKFFLDMFPDSPIMQRTLRNMSDTSLKALKKSPIFKQLAGDIRSDAKVGPAEAYRQLQSTKVAEEAVDEMGGLINGTGTPANPNNLGTKMALKVIDENKKLSPIPEALINAAANADVMADLIKNPEIKGRKASGWFPKFLTDMRTLASRLPVIADILNVVRSHQNVKDGLNKFMQHQRNLIETGLKEKGTFKAAHKALETLDANNATFDGTHWTYKDKEGNIHRINPELNESIKALDAYYKIPAQFARDTKVQQLKNTTDPEVQQSIVKEIEKLNSLLKAPYYPRMRFGSIAFKVGDHVYFLEEIEGLNHANVLPGAKIKVGDTYLHGEQWNNLKKRAKEEQGIDLGDPQKYWKDSVKGKLEDMTMFRMNTADPSTYKFDSFLEDEAIINLLEKADQDRLRYFQRYSKDNKTLDRLLRPRKKTPGSSIDYERMMTHAHNGSSNGFVNYIFEQPLRKLHSEYKNGTQPKFVQDYMDLIFDNRNTKNFSDSAVRLQAFMALAFAPATAALQTVSHISSTPMQIGIAEANPLVTAKYLFNPTAQKLFLNRLRGQKRGGTSDYNLMKKMSGKDFADFVFSHSRVFSNNPKLDYINAANSGTRGLSKRFSQMEDMGHGLMMRTEEATRLASGHAIFSYLKVPKNLEKMKNALKNDARVQDALAKRGNVPEHHVLTEILMDGAFGIYGKIGWAPFQRGLGRLAVPFASYPLQITNTMLDHARGLNGRRAQLAAGLNALNMTIIFGMAGAPMFSAMELIYEFLNKLIGKPGKELDKDLFDAMYEVNPDAARFLKRGFVGSMLGIDFGKRVEIGSPFVSFFDTLTTEGSMGKPVGFLPQKAKDIKGAFETGDKLKIATAIAPIGLGNLVKGLVEYPTQGVTTKRGEVIIPEEDLSVSDYMKRASGFSPISESNAKEALYSSLTESRKYTGPKRRTIRRAYPYYKKYLDSGQKDAEAYRKLREILIDYRDLHTENGDVYSRDKHTGMLSSLKKAYLNEKGFVGGHPKASLRQEIKAEGLEYLKRLEGTE